jgi:hypothetical protein
MWSWTAGAAAAGAAAAGAAAAGAAVIFVVEAVLKLTHILKPALIVGC